MVDVGGWVGGWVAVWVVRLRVMMCSRTLALVPASRTNQPEPSFPLPLPAPQLPAWLLKMTGLEVLDLSGNFFLECQQPLNQLQTFKRLRCVSAGWLPWR